MNTLGLPTVRGIGGVALRTRSAIRRRAKTPLLHHFSTRDFATSSTGLPVGVIIVMSPLDSASVVVIRPSTHSGMVLAPRSCCIPHRHHAAAKIGHRRCGATSFACMLHALATGATSAPTLCATPAASLHAAIVVSACVPEVRGGHVHQAPSAALRIESPQSISDDVRRDSNVRAV
uniref:Uncharacterized protein n=1 Tax=Mycena chlorophos TaxID=658473 RepID=A0ABQ0KYS3_MYCCL|nr:predicted protein [Mycena chlorophos]